MNSKFRRPIALILSAVALVAGLVLVRPGIPAQAAQSGKTIRLGTSPGPYSQLFLDGVKPILQKEGYTVTTQSFSDLIHADLALSQGDVDLNVEQHSAWLENFNKEKHSDFVALTPIPTVPAGIFPGSSKSLKNIKKGAKVAIPNDPSNLSRAYQLLAQAKLITLKSKATASNVTQHDIKSNPHSLKFVEMSSAQIPRAIKDVNYAVIPGSISYNAKIPAKSALKTEKLQKQYLLVATVNKSEANKPWAKAVKKAYQSKTFKDYVKNHNKQGYWYIPK
ncbi:NLPA lipoprotein [Agrilactobacillus composti DSM 18527 = JCM 14202]|uniref:NLPA lipoprotein n=1 Tax=Agrilactobacillus composti DSM 18527 = JCM 14202 TaxID=1423734 RepID=X0PUP8_9LACO|nr:MetQ/NlpA family ABC transporter substrate-binding protein [Agrilactobacillus composti]KRM32725.1 NLPA lipoprotein [Agrilactobacillus composti DSM 18527 = JCM 14202]GAF41852.1 methionine ABC transporter substrate-binding protein [Agrilactobacillus composti DSM 18527 = JCM 14202]